MVKLEFLFSFLLKKFMISTTVLTIHLKIIKLKQLCSAYFCFSKQVIIFKQKHKSKLYITVLPLLRY